MAKPGALKQSRSVQARRISLQDVRHQERRESRRNLFPVRNSSIPRQSRDVQSLANLSPVDAYDDKKSRDDDGLKSSPAIIPEHPRNPEASKQSRGIKAIPIFLQEARRFVFKNPGNFLSDHAAIPERPSPANFASRCPAPEATIFLTAPFKKSDPGNPRRRWPGNPRRAIPVRTRPRRSIPGQAPISHEVRPGSVKFFLAF